MMAYTLSPEVQRLVETNLASGLYQSTDELLIEALRALGERNAELAEIRAGFEDLDAGRIRPMRDVADEVRLRLGLGNDA